jgi:hypothetical protein
MEGASIGGPRAPVARWADVLRPHPDRGDLIAAGAVLLTVGLVVVDLRFNSTWSAFARFLVMLGGALVVFGMALLAPLEEARPRAYHSVLLVAGLALVLATLGELSNLLGADGGSGGNFWVFGAWALIAASCAARFNSAVCGLIAAVASGASSLFFVDWVFNPHSISTFRYLLLVLVVAYAAGSLNLRDRPRPRRTLDDPVGTWRRHAVQLVNAAGIATLALVGTFAFEAIGLAADESGPSGFHVAWGWELFFLVVGCGLLAYAAVDREPGPGYFGFFVLVGFAFLIGQLDGKPSLIGWPIFLLLVGGVAVAAGLRPLRPLPPEPGSAGGGAGVREPRRPWPGGRGGTAAVVPDEPTGEDAGGSVATFPDPGEDPTTPQPPEEPGRAP